MSLKPAFPFLRCFSFYLLSMILCSLMYNVEVFESCRSLLRYDLGKTSQLELRKDFFENFILWHSIMPIVLSFWIR